MPEPARKEGKAFERKEKGVIGGEERKVGVKKKTSIGKLAKKWEGGNLKGRQGMVRGKKKRVARGSGALRPCAHLSGGEKEEGSLPWPEKKGARESKERKARNRATAGRKGSSPDGIKHQIGLKKETFKRGRKGNKRPDPALQRGVVRRGKKRGKSASCCAKKRLLLSLWKRENNNDEGGGNDQKSGRREIGGKKKAPRKGGRDHAFFNRWLCQVRGRRGLRPTVGPGVTKDGERLRGAALESP